MNILIQNGTIITLDAQGQVLYNHDLVLSDQKVKAIVPAGSYTDEIDTHIDATGKVVMPAYINAHMHFYSTMVRGLGKAEPSADFGQVLQNLWWRLDKKLSLDDCYYSTLIMAVEAIKKGCTTFIDHHASPGAVAGSLHKIAEALGDTGLRGCLCYELSDRDGEQIAEAGLSENVDFIKHCADEQSPMLAAMFGLHASFTLSDKTLRKAVDLAIQYDTGFHVHLAEALSDQELTQKMCGCGVVERFNREGVLGPKTIAAHCVHIDDKEIELLAASNTMAVHNPQSNLNNAVGIANTVALAKAGILTGLGTDAMTVDMPQEVRVAMWAQHLKQNNPSAAFMQTCNLLYNNNRQIVSRVFNGLKTGVIEPGAAADIILVDYIAPTPLNSQTALGHLVYGIGGAPVDTTISNGHILMRHKQLNINIDEQEINAKSRELATALWNRF